MKKFFLFLFMLQSQLIAADTVVALDTSKGEIQLTLIPETAPKAVENFLTHLKNGYYDGLKFYRVINGLVIMSGDPLNDGTGGASIWGSPFADEILSTVKFSEKGILAMSKVGSMTNGSQFMITTVEAPYFDGLFTIFGKVTSGYDIVEAIEMVSVDINQFPLEDIIINSTRVISE